MKTAGDLLREKRLLKELTVEQVAAKIKVKPEYLNALEASDFDSLPGETTTKGFLRNYASALRLNPDTLLAMFRRDFEVQGGGEIVPRGLVEPVSHAPRLLSASRILSWSAALAFVGFLVYQLIGWWSLPQVELIQPQEGEVYGEKITFKGKTSRDNVVTISGQKVLIGADGEFSLDLLLPAGVHSVTVEVTNRQGKSRLVERTFTVSK